MRLVFIEFFLKKIDRRLKNGFFLCQTLGSRGIFNKNHLTCHISFDNIVETFPYLFGLSLKIIEKSIKTMNYVIIKYILFENVSMGWE